jgi:NADPH2:quinone reductase
MTALMRAVELSADGSVRVTSRPRPTVGPSDVLVRVAAAGICGSDLSATHNGSFPPGTVMGHEVVGHVVEAGSAVNDGTELDRVVVVPLAWCGHCRWCTAGAAQLCTESWRGSIGLGDRTGGFAEFLAVDITSCRPFPANPPTALGALVEPFAVGLHAVRRSILVDRPGVPAAVFGAGTIGLMVLSAARLCGAAPVVVEANPVRAEVARALGAAAVVNSADAVTTALGTAPELVFDCTGSTQAPAQAFDQIAPGGQVILVGVLAKGADYAVPGRVWVAKELDCRASTGYNMADFDDALAAIVTGTVNVLPVIGGLRPLAAAAAAFAELTRPDAVAKLLLTPDSPSSGLLS